MVKHAMGILFVFLFMMCRAQTASKQIKFSNDTLFSTSMFVKEDFNYSGTLKDPHLKRRLLTQRILKGWGIFNIAWGGAWFLTGTYLGLASSENRLLGFIPAAMGAGASALGIRRLRITNRKIKNIKKQIRLGASTKQVSISYSF